MMPVRSETCQQIAGRISVTVVALKGLESNLFVS
jgi:hypothetical protein